MPNRNNVKEMADFADEILERGAELSSELTAYFTARNISIAESAVAMILLLVFLESQKGVQIMPLMDLLRAKAAGDSECDCPSCRAKRTH